MWPDHFMKRFEACVPDAPTDSCWPWNGTRDKHGYGLVTLGYRQFKAHRVAYSIATGELPPSAVVIRHRCDNPPCVNPAHLLPGTPADNTADMLARGRESHKPRAVGLQNGSTKVNELTVRRIRALHGEGNSRSRIAAVIGISASQVGNIVARRHWRGVQ